MSKLCQDLQKLLLQYQAASFLSYDAACLYLENLGVWVLQSVDSLTIEDLDPLLKSV